MFTMMLSNLAICALSAPNAIPTVDLFHQLDPRLPHGDYRIPSLLTSSNGTLLAFIAGRFHRTDMTPNIIYLRRSFDDGATWTEAAAILNDPTNRTEFGGAPVLCPKTGAIILVHTQNGPSSGGPCPACLQWQMESHDHGATWSEPKQITIKTGTPNTTYGGALASGIALTRGAHAGRLMVALRHDCGCGDLKSSFVIFSDDQGATWTGGQQMMLLPEFGGGWTECEVAEMHNGSVLLTSRNFYGASSGQGPRLMARSDDGGATWAAN